VSYDIYLRPPAFERGRCPTCGSVGEEPDCPGPTYNLTPIFDLALTGEVLPNAGVTEAEVVLFREETDRPRGLRLLNGRMARDTAGDIDRAIDRLADQELTARFVALEPPNKWGTLPVALNVMRRLKILAKKYPDNIWEIR
jgi:hypothetical protein